MGIVFKADEVFEMAEQIERNGVKYYHRASEIVDASDVRDKLRYLEKMEKQHEKVFARMRHYLPTVNRLDVVPDPDNQAVLYLHALASSHVFDMSADPLEKLTGKESLQDIFELALQFEKDSIVFFLGIQEIVPDRLGKEEISRIIKEEMAHVTLLSSQLESLKGKAART